MDDVARLVVQGENLENSGSTFPKHKMGSKFSFMKKKTSVKKTFLKAKHAFYLTTKPWKGP